MLDGGVGVLAVQPVVGGVGSGELAVQREHDGVDDRRFSRARGPLQQEQPSRCEGVEVDGKGARKGADARDGQSPKPH